MGGDFTRKGGPELLGAWRAGAFARWQRLTLVSDSPVDAMVCEREPERHRGMRAYTPAWRDSGGTRTCS